MTLSLQLLMTGLAAGGVYGLVAVGHSLIYRLTGVVHFALGDLIGLSVFATLLVAAGTGPLTQAQAGAPRFLAAVVVGLLVAMAVGAGGYLLVIQPYVRRGSTIGWIAGTLALAFAVRALISTLFERPSYAFPDPIPFHRLGHDGRVTVAGGTFQVRSVFVLGVALLLALAAVWALERTRVGRALRAIADDREGALFCGVPAELLVTAAFAFAGAFAVLAAIAAAPSAPIDADTGSLLGLKGLAAALVVGFGSPLRSFAAGVLLGLVEAAITGLEVGGVGLGSEWREVLPLLLALAIVTLSSRRAAAEQFE